LIVLFITLLKWLGSLIPRSETETESGLGDWLATPFVWIWNQLILPILRWAPIAWLGTHILIPVASILGRIIGLIPVAFIFIFKLMILGLPGLLVAEAVRGSIAEKMDVRGAFSHGLTLGLLLADGLLLWILAVSGKTSALPPASLLFLSLTVAVGTVRFSFRDREQPSDTPLPPLLRRLEQYASDNPYGSSNAVLAFFRLLMAFSSESED
jgi:hypothetical protein